MFGVSRTIVAATLFAGSTALSLTPVAAFAAVHAQLPPAAMSGRLVADSGACHPGDFYAMRSTEGVLQSFVACPGSGSSYVAASVRTTAAPHQRVAAAEEMVESRESCAPGKYWMMSNPNGDAPIACR